MNNRSAHYFWGVYMLLLVLIVVFFVISAADAHSGMTHDEHHRDHQAAVGATQGYRRSEAGYVVPNVRIVDESGRAVDLTSVLAGDAPIFLNFIFTTCTAVCPILTATFGQVQERLGPERDSVRMISLSVDPEQDTPDVLLGYAKKHNAGPQWRFFTGGLSDMISIEKSFDIYRGNKMNHEPATFIRAGAASKWTRIDGFASADDLVREYRQLPKPR